MSDLPQKIGRFPILDTLGVGGMGVVYLARDPDIGRKVAIKVLHSVGDQATLERFKNEARTIGELSHPNIVILLEYGVEDSQPFLVMEYLPGESLAQWKKRPHTLFEHKKVLLGLCEALDYAHQQDILHRDLKPGNVQVLPGGYAKLLDFGIARSGDTGLTATGFFIGTPKYLAPEILSGEPHSKASDSYSLALMVYSTLCGHNPFEGSQFEAVMTKKLTVIPPLLHQLNPDIPKSLSTVVSAYLEQSPENRPKGLGPLKQALESLASDKQLSQRIEPLKDGGVLGATTVLQTVSVTQGGKKSWLLVVLSGLVVIGLAYWLATKNTQPKTQAEPETQTIVAVTDQPRQTSPAFQADTRSKAGSQTAGQTPASVANQPETHHETSGPPGKAPDETAQAANKPERQPETVESAEATVELAKQVKKTRKSISRQHDPSRPVASPQSAASKKTVSPVAGTDRSDTPSDGQKNHRRQSDVTLADKKEATGNNIEALEDNLFADNRDTPVRQPTTSRINLPSFGQRNEQRGRLRLEALSSTEIPRGKASRLVVRFPDDQSLDGFVFYRGRKPTRHITLVKQKNLPDNRIQLTVYVEPNAVLGEYTLAALRNGKKSQPLTLEVTL